MPEKKSKGEELKEKLFMKQPDAYEKLSEKEIEKAYKDQAKEEKETVKVLSPYTKAVNKKEKYFILVYVLIFLLVILTIIWSVKQITVDKHVAATISYVD